MNFIKKYWSHILNIIYLVLVDGFIGICIYGMNNEEMMSGIPISIFLLFLLVELVLTFTILGEMIYAIVKAAQDKELSNKALHIIGLYFLNIFYVPCFLLKHVSREEKVAAKNTVYLIISITLYILLFALTIGLSASSI